MLLQLTASTEQRELFTFKRFADKTIIHHPDSERLIPCVVLWEDGTAYFADMKKETRNLTHQTAFEKLYNLYYK